MSSSIPSPLSESSDISLSNPTDGQALTYSAAQGKWINSTVVNDTTAPIVVLWSSATGWGTYSTDVSRVRYFHSQNDATATAPTYYSAYDLWFRHPEAV